ncbi:hypothetical protein BKN38_00395 [Helicobacter sp. CLO-3]|nr:hypothetical protein BA723_02240 [Helicobacter sp. CLO-3]OHU85895.1 hypothetical protein BKN38_00395 [Helicobacter sp. CLO-3]
MWKPKCRQTKMRANQNIKAARARRQKHAKFGRFRACYAMTTWYFCAFLSLSKKCFDNPKLPSVIASGLAREAIHLRARNLF